MLSFIFILSNSNSEIFCFLFLEYMKRQHILTIKSQGIYMNTTRNVCCYDLSLLFVSSKCEPNIKTLRERKNNCKSRGIIFSMQWQIDWNGKVLNLKSKQIISLAVFILYVGRSKCNTSQTFRIQLFLIMKCMQTHTTHAFNFWKRVVMFGCLL